MIIGAAIGSSVGGIAGARERVLLTRKNESDLIVNEASEISCQVSSIVGYPNIKSIRKATAQVTKAAVGLRSAAPLAPAPSVSSPENKGPLSRLAPLEAILFDLDGTLCDSDAVNIHAFREMLLEMGYNNGVPISEEFFTQNISGKNTEAIARVLFPDWDIEKAMKWMDVKDVAFRKAATEHLEPIKGLQELCKWVEQRGLKRAVVTNSTRINAEFMISEMGLGDFFDLLVVGDECERAKPFPDPYLKALELLNVSPQHTFIFEDSASGTKAGVDAGMPVVGLKSRNPEKSLFDAGVSFIIKDYNDPRLWKALEELEAKGKH